MHRHWNFQRLLSEMCHGMGMWEVWQFVKNLNIYLSYDVATLHLFIYCLKRENIGYTETVHRYSKELYL